MLRIILTIFFAVTSLWLNAANKNTAPIKRGGQFKDLFLPVPIINGLESDVWGAENVIPRDADNGLEDAEYSYWGGNIITSEDGKFHAFICRWPEDNVKGSATGHHTWWSSTVVHATSDNPLGPYKVESTIGDGHNPEIYKLKDGTYIIGVLGGAYKGATLNGPWTKLETDLLHHMDWVMNENKTYVVREDGSVLMMNKNGIIFISENADESFLQVSDKGTFSYYAGSNMEDPVIWKDEVQYHCVYNDSFGRIAFYMRSPDGINWKWEDGVAYDPSIIKLEDGTTEDWYKIERPKVIQDKYGRATHMNFAVIDVTKDEDRANDNHSSKNVVVPLALSRRLEILNSETINSSTNEIRVKIYADEDFNPQTDIDLASLKFGASELVNIDKGCKALTIEADGTDAIITFEGDGNGLSSESFTAKLLGQTKNGDLVYGYAKYEPNPLTTGNIQAFDLPDSIPNKGSIPVQIKFNTSKLCKIAVKLVNKETNITKTQKNYYAHNTGKAIVHIPLVDLDTTSNLYQWKVMLYPDDVNGATSCIDSIIQDVSVYKKIDYAATIGSWSIKNISASSEARWHQRASNAFDNDKLTYWEPKNSSKEWIQASLSTSVTIQGVQIKFYRGDLRIYNIEILGSKDGVNWETYFSGNSQLSGDLTSNFIFDEEKQFSYFKVITNGSDVSRQNGIFEIIPLAKYGIKKSNRNFIK